MEDNLTGKTCFVIMPFGEKKDIDGQPVNFDVIYKDFIKDAVEGLNLKCIRCDEIAEAGWIHSKMFEYIFSADVAVVDITSLNPNVFYELGIRHALKKSVTVLIRKAGTPTPFNIQGFQMLEYKPDDSQNLESGKQKIREFIKNGIAGQVLDSPIYEVLDNLKVERKPKRIGTKNTYLYPIAKVAGKEVGMITGDIQNIKEIDVWVNSENTNMQMARHFERSISATIRYLGAKRDRAGRVIEDLVANELRKEVGDTDVPAGIVVPTGSGELQKSHNVKKIFHAASVMGQVGRGYMPITEIAECVRNSLKLIDSDEMAAESIQSILFPLMGTGTTRLDSNEISRQLIDAAISYVEENPQTKVQKIYFLAYHEEDLNICRHILEHESRIAHSKV
ncbi:MAG: macro domain-containing protein [Anaerolineales bacterium]|nr:macro domain-containing protein [Anaerolineales bacterium]